MNDMESWGLTDLGFYLPDYSECLNAVEYKARELFGNEVKLTVRSFLGMTCRIVAWIMYGLYKIQEKVYNSQFIDTATGSALSNFVRIIGLRRLESQKSQGYLTVTGIVGKIVPPGFLASNIAGVQYVTKSGAVIAGDSGTTSSVTVPAQCTVTGIVGNTDAGTVTRIVNPTSGIIGVTNEKPFIGGQGRETDSELRARYLTSVDFAGGVNIDAICAEILQTVEGIYSCTGTENDTDFTVGELHPHSFMITVFGGNDEDVARAIFRRRAAGIATVGTVSVQISTTSGDVLAIRFNRPAEVGIYVKIENLTVDERELPIDYEEQIKQKVINYIGTGLDSNEVITGLTNGEDVYASRIYCPVNGVSGVLDCSISVSIDGENWGSKIDISNSQKSTTSSEKITVNLS